jgi:hypothetical protein
MFVAWYTERLRKTKVGTISATAHFAGLLSVIALICISPGNDWPWWTVVPFCIDFPLSVPMQYLFSGIGEVIERLPHSALERFLLSMREPFSSFDLFWLPAVGYLVLGTIWYYYWTQGLVHWGQRIDRNRRAKQRAGVP